MINELHPDYSVEVDCVSKESWNLILEGFDDANIYQTWPYEAVVSGEESLSHLVVRKNGEMVAAAQARIKKIPFTNIGAAYFRWGPVWKLSGKEPDLEVFAQTIRALRNEYASRRRLVTWILPLLFTDQSDLFEPVLAREGFSPVSIQRPQRTLLVNLEPSLEQLRKGLDQKWRNRLNRAERNRLEVIDGDEDKLFEDFIEIYRQMHGRKKFVETSDVHQFRTMQRDLPPSFRMKVLIAFFEGKPAAGIICSKIGEMGMYLFAGTSNAGLDSQGSYLLQWKVMTWLKEIGAKWYNLHGINPEVNPGTYRFKSGLCGKNGKDVCYLGTYGVRGNYAATRVAWLAILARNLFRHGRRNLNKLL